jgi:hypothetical protein
MVLREMFQTLPLNLEPELTNSALVKSVRSGDDSITTTLDAIRVVRNDLSHGNRTYERQDLAEAADIFERVVRGDLLRLLGGLDRGNHACPFTRQLSRDAGNVSGPSMESLLRLCRGIEFFVGVRVAGLAVSRYHCVVEAEVASVGSAQQMTRIGDKPQMTRRETACMTAVQCFGK